MLFNSFEFIFLFLPCTAAGFYLLRRAGQASLALGWLTGCALLFYAWGNPHNLPVLLGSLLFNYAVARAMGDAANAAIPAARRKQLLIAGIGANVALLAGFKIGAPLPLGISFYTLMQVMYLVDCYEGMIAPSGLLDHALFTTFFPAMSMGPILRVKDTLAPLLAAPARGPDMDQLARAIMLFSIGLFKKLVLADSFARFADAGYASPATLSMLEGWGSALAYACQLYYDFSGYTDMAVASALVLGVRIPVNFNSPYQARSIVDFWKRWHISLTNFITTYIYTPMVRSFRQLTFPKAMWATLLSMLIAGVWHGSSWNFVIFGALHGIGLIVNHCRKRAKAKKLPDLLAWIATFAYVNLALIFFRAPTLTDALYLLRSLGNLHAIGSTATWSQTILGYPAELLLAMLLGTAMLFMKKNSNQIVKEFQPSWKNLSWVSASAVISVIYLNSTIARGFLYRDF